MSETQTRAGNEHMTAGWDEGAELCGIHKPRLGSLTRLLYEASPCLEASECL